MSFPITFDEPEIDSSDITDWLTGIGIDDYKDVDFDDPEAYNYFDLSDLGPSDRNDVMRVIELAKKIDTVSPSAYCDDGLRIIREDQMEDYAREYADDIGADIGPSSDWPWMHVKIDWEAAGNDLKDGLGEIEVNGNTYYVT